MNNTIEFVLRMKNLMSSELTKVGSASQSTFSKVAKSVDQVTGRNKILGMSFNELQTKIKQTEDTISRSTIPSQIAAARRELGALQSQAAKHSGNLGGGISPSGSGGIGIGGIAMGNVVGNLATKAAGYVIDGVSEMIQKSMEKERAIAGMSTFLGKSGAIDAYKNIRNDASITSFDTASLLQVNRALVSTGLDARSARFDTMNLANAIVAVGGGNDELSRMAVNMAQIKQAGKATLMDIRQFAYAGINIYEMLSRSTGKTIAQIREMDITYEQLAKSMAVARGKGGIYENALEINANTKSGKWDTVKDLSGNALSDIGDAFSLVIVKLLDMGIRFASSISDGITRAQPYIDIFSNSINQGVDYIMAIVNGTSEWSDYTNKIMELVNYIAPAFLKIGRYVGSMLGDIFEFIKKSEILRGILSLVVGVAKYAWDIISWAADKIMWLWKNAVMPILNAVERAYRWIAGIKDVKVTATKNIISVKPKGDDPKNSPLGAGGALMATNNASGQTAGETVAGAGPKVVNIHVGKFFDTIQFTTMDGKETAEELEKVVMEVLARVLYNGAKTV